MVKNRTICLSRIRVSPSKGGFTLIASILVVSLLTVLVVAATIVAQIEEQAAYNASRQEIARQNALFGLNEALNQLQTAAGPDRRATARADIITANMTGSQTTGPTNLGYTANTPAVDAGQSFWTGVWKNTSNDYSGSAGNGFATNPDPAPGQNPGPGGSFLYYDYTPDGNANMTSGSATMAPGTIPSRDQLYNNKNVNWLVSWPYANGVNPPDPTKTLAAQLPSTVLPTRSGNVTLTSSAGNPTATTSNLVTIVTGLNIITNQNYGNISGGNGKVNYIDVPKVPILENQPGTPSGTAQVAVGTFAYWIADEGIKGKSNIPDPYLGSSTVGTAQAHFQVAQSASASQAVIGQNSLSSGSYGATAPIDLRISAVIAPTLPSLAYAEGTQSWLDVSNYPNNYSSDFTVSSYGVLADSFNGGLKQDLTAALENQQIYVAQFGNNNKVNEPSRKLYSMDGILQQAQIPDIKAANWSSTGQGMIMDGLRFDSLFFYYNIYHSTMPSPTNASGLSSPLAGFGSSFSAECGGTTPALTARVYEETNLTGGAVDMDGFFPMLSYWNYNFGIDLNCTNPAATSPPYTYDFVIGESPNVILYNPFDVAVNQPAASYEEIKGNVGSFAGSNPLPMLAILNKTTNKNDWPIAGGAAGTGQSVTFPDPDVIVDTDLTAYAPGESRAYGLSSNAANPVLVASSQAYSTVLGATATANCTSFTTTSLNRLVPTGFAIGNIQEEEITALSPSISLTSPSSDEFIAFGNHRIGANFMTYSRKKYYLWPSSTSTGTISTGNLNLPNLPWTGSQTNIIDASLSYGPPGVKVPDSGLGLVESMEDHIPGLSVTNFTLNTLVTPPAAVTIGLPGFAAGGPEINPLNTDMNVYARDFQNTGKLTGSPLSSSGDLQINPLPIGSVTKAGWQANSAGKASPNRTVVYDLPRQPLLSLGQFKNMYCHYAANTGNPNYNVLGFSFFTLGGSYQAGLPTNFAFVNAKSIAAGYGVPPEACLLDDNFLANETLFDEFFLSTVPPSGLTDSANWQIANASAFSQNYIDTNQPLPNSRLVYYDRLQSTSIPFNGNPPNGTNSPNISDLQCSNSATANIRKPAANLLINGAFNINSTSVPAWVALLTATSATKGGQNLMKLFASQSGGASTAVSSKTFGTTEAPFQNFNLASGPSAWTGAVDQNVPWFGLVDLGCDPTNSSNTIETLAKNIVKEVQLRGPFLSLGDFLNHRLSAAENGYSTSGALQYAIDGYSTASWPTWNSSSTYTLGPVNSSAATSAGQSISTAHNSTYSSQLLTSNSGSYPTGYTKNILPDNPSPTGAGVPGTLLQNDLVQVIAPVIASRSDTFTIRVYGQALSPTGTSEAEAYCEAVVQRIPEYLYSTENGITDSSGKANYAYDNPSPSTTNTETINGSNVNVSGLTTENSAFGRRFRIVSIRWLNKNEI